MTTPDPFAVVEEALRHGRAFANTVHPETTPAACGRVVVKVNAALAALQALREERGRLLAYKGRTVADERDYEFAERIFAGWRARAEKAEAERERLTRLNSGLTADFNAMLVEEGKQRTRAERAEAERDELRASLANSYPWSRAHAAEAERDEARKALRAIHFNASSWHAGEDGCRRALNVIQAWAAHPESIPEGVGEARVALGDEA